MRNSEDPGGRRPRARAAARRLALAVTFLAAPSCLALLAGLAVAQPPGGEGGPPPLPPPRNIPGITASDTHPGGCVDCHINYTEMNMDTRLSTLLSQWSEEVEPGLLAKAQAACPEGLTLKGKHPAAAFSLKNIPSGCLTCHGAKSTKAPPFARLMHSIHLTGGEKSPYLTLFQGECTLCHKLDAASGALSIPSGPEK